MKSLAFLLCPLLGAVAVAADAPRAPGKVLNYLVLSQVSFREATFDAVLDYFRRKAEQASGGVVKLEFVRRLPADFQLRHELTLELNNVPFAAALSYLGDLAGVEFSIEGSKITAVRPESRRCELRRRLS